MARGVKAVTDEPAVLGPAPAHANELCAECGQHELHPSTTVFACDHGVWQFDPAAVEAEVPSDEDKRAAALAILGLSEEQYAALTPAE